MSRKPSGLGVPVVSAQFFLKMVPQSSRESMIGSHPGLEPLDRVKGNRRFEAHRYGDILTAAAFAIARNE
jgi:hypothetical protein